MHRKPPVISAIFTTQLYHVTQGKNFKPFLSCVGPCYMYIIYIYIVYTTQI